MKINLPRIVYYTDGAHGWYAVKRSLIDELGIAQRITPFSYQKGGTVYLEEDCDAGVFFNALEAAGFTPAEISSRTVERDQSMKGPSRIRYYEDYKL